MKCRKCRSEIAPIWNDWELCPTCGYRYNIETGKSPDNMKDINNFKIDVQKK